ncbi:hypothetical protein BC828DRAFT_409981, partial [Blastocladiella britannica]
MTALAQGLCEEEAVKLGEAAADRVRAARGAARATAAEEEEEEATEEPARERVEEGATRVRTTATGQESARDRVEEGPVRGRIEETTGNGIEEEPAADRTTTRHLVLAPCSAGRIMKPVCLGCTGSDNEHCRGCEKKSPCSCTPFCFAARVNDEGASGVRASGSGASGSGASGVGASGAAGLPEELSGRGLLPRPLLDPNKLLFPPEPRCTAQRKLMKDKDLDAFVLDNASTYNTSALLRATALIAGGWWYNAKDDCAVVNRASGMTWHSRACRAFERGVGAQVSSTLFISLLGGTRTATGNRVHGLLKATVPAASGVPSTCSFFNLKLNPYTSTDTQAIAKEMPTYFATANVGIGRSRYLAIPGYHPAFEALVRNVLGGSHVTGKNGCMVHVFLAC